MAFLHAWCIQVNPRFHIHPLDSRHGEVYFLCFFLSLSTDVYSVRMTDPSKVLRSFLPDIHRKQLVVTANVIIYLYHRHHHHHQLSDFSFGSRVLHGIREHHDNTIALLAPMPHGLSENAQNTLLPLSDEAKTYQLSNTLTDEYLTFLF